MLGGTSASARAGFPGSFWQWDGADRLGKQHAKARPRTFHNGISWQARLGEPLQHVYQGAVADHYGFFVAEALPRFCLGRKQNCKGGALHNCEVRLLGGDEFLGSEEAMEAPEQRGSSAWKATCTEPPRQRCYERRGEGGGPARQLMLLPGAEQSPTAGEMSPRPGKIMLDAADGVRRVPDRVTFFPA